MKHFALLCFMGFWSISLHASSDNTRGIGQYPGAPNEYFAPTVSWADGQTLTNVALHRRAYASSAIDYNHTAHLVNSKFLIII